MSDLAITGARIAALGHAMGRKVPTERAEAYALALEAERERGGLSSPRRVRHFIAQIAHESGGFRSLVESTGYRDPARLDALFSSVHGVGDARRLIAAGPVAIGNRIYAGRLGNGSEHSGDGYRYRGRGFIMVTGRSNYARAERDSGLPLLAQPELLGQTDKAAIASMTFWRSRRINISADADDLHAVTLLVNGPRLVGLAERREWLSVASAIWR